MADYEHKWYGDEIADELTRATGEGLEGVAADFTRVAHPLTPIKEGFLRRSTRANPVERHADGQLSIEMGSFDINYAAFQERGTSKMEGKFFYQRSADETWPKLPDRIKTAMRSPAA